jgi:hypothetical protein
MKFDARKPHTREEKEVFVGWLLSETVSTFQRSAGNPEGLKTAVFLLTNRAREAGLSDSEVSETTGVAIARAGLNQEDEDVVLDWLEALDPIAAAVHASDQASKPWWRFWK